MKIALIHFRIRHHGGLEKRLLNYSAALVEAGHEVTILYARRYRGVQLPAGVHTVRLGVRWVRRAYRQQAFSNKVQAYLAQHSFDFSLSLGRTVGQDAVLAPGNHLGYLAALGRQPQGPKDIQQIALDQTSFDSSKHIFAASDMMRQEVIDMYGVPAHKVHTLLPPLNLATFTHADAAQRQAARQQLGIPEGVFVGLFVSLSHGRKGLPLLLEVFRQLDPRHFILLVAGDRAQASQLPHVRNLGYVRNPAMLYAAADVTLHPALYEPFGQIISESLAVGTPVIVSPGVGAKQIVTPASGQVLPLQAALWQDALQHMAQAPQRVPAGIMDGLALSTQVHLDAMFRMADVPPA